MTSLAPAIESDFSDLLRKGSLGSPSARGLSSRTDPIWAEIVRWQIEALDEAAIDDVAETPPVASSETQPSDAEPVRRALSARTDQERKAAFEAIADRYHLLVLRQCAQWFSDPDAAQDVAQSAFAGAFSYLAQGRGPEDPDKLGGWLVEIARRCAREYLRRAAPAAVTWAVLPEGLGLDDLEADEEPRSGSAVRRAHTTRLVEAVAATLTARQQQIYHLRFVQELTGRQAAAHLGITAKAASNEITHVQDLIAEGFGALVLFQEGRPYCPALAQIIDTWIGAAPSGTDAFTTGLRERIVRHFSDCSTGDDCRTCNTKRRELVGPYAP